MNQLRQNILGVMISVIDLDQALAYCQDQIETRQPSYICVAPAHSIMDCYDDVKLKEIFNKSGLTTPDGMAVVWILKMKGNKTVSRVYGPDLLLSLCELSNKEGWKHYFYGSTNQVLNKLQTRLLKEYPEVNICGAYAPSIQVGKITERKEVIDNINQLDPDIVWVGLGSPKQEYWMSEHREKLNAPLLIGVGAAFDFVSGNINQAPRWIQRGGIEWLYRLLNEPRRLWRRYIKYPKFVLLVLKEWRA
ncbi:MAG: WecB/TagA/CpsF family glycosyltransferase [Anaerolineales bacterium]|nr:WecB/TagA/CpsF family glycosyltransferase [Anaerolineales bacterium]